MHDSKSYLLQEELETIDSFWKYIGVMNLVGGWCWCDWYAWLKDSYLINENAEKTNMYDSLIFFKKISQYISSVIHIVGWWCSWLLICMTLSDIFNTRKWEKNNCDYYKI